MPTTFSIPVTLHATAIVVAENATEAYGIAASHINDQYAAAGAIFTDLSGATGPADDFRLETKLFLGQVASLTDIDEINASAEPASDSIPPGPQPDQEAAADILMPTVFHQGIPYEDISPLERLLLARIFDETVIDGKAYFKSDETPRLLIEIDRSNLETAITQTETEYENAARLDTAHLFTKRWLSDHPAENPVNLDLTKTSWDFFVQDIVHRSKTLNYVTIAQSFIPAARSRTPRTDPHGNHIRTFGYGGQVILVTGDDIYGKVTSDVIEDLLNDAGLSDPERP